MQTLKFIDLFCGIGGFRYAFESAAQQRGFATRCEFSSDIDPFCRKAYEANFGEAPSGDIRKAEALDIPDHDILLAGFPCQPFSIIGSMKGFEDTRGTLFFEIARILEAKRPRAFVLENVKLLKGHDKGRTLRKILATLRELGYKTDHRILNALDFGLPQRRERIWIVGTREKIKFSWPEGKLEMKPLDEILEKEVPKKHFASEKIRLNRKAATAGVKPVEASTIWHENKSGHVSVYPFSCALRAGASYNYLLVNGERRMTPREMLRLQGFPENFKDVCSDTQTRKQAGNSLPVNVANVVIGALLDALAAKTPKLELEHKPLPEEAAV